MLTPQTDSLSTFAPLNVGSAFEPDFRIERDSAPRAAYEVNKLEKRLCRQVGQAIVEFNMIEEGDKVMVCVSGGKDSYAMLDILLKLKARAPIHFDLIAVNLDQKQPGFPAEVLPNYLHAPVIYYALIIGCLIVLGVFL